MGINSNATTNCEPGPPNGEPGFEHSARKDGTSKDDIAIIGTACRLPGGVHDSEALWNMLTQKLDGWSEMPKDRFTTEGFYHPNPSKRGAFNARGAHFLQEDISLFDAQFFNITANEANAMDPQHRILLECSYEALENAGLTIEGIAGGKTGVFMGASYPDYSVHLLRDTETCPMYHGTGTAEALLSNRISYFFDLKGPSMTIETACSSALSSLHMACQSIHAGDSTQAIVGACHLNVIPDTFVSLAKSQLLSPEGRSYAFDERATSGYGRGEGAVAIVVKALSQAIRDGDPIRAVIRGSGINQDGKTAGITQPNGAAQEELMRSVYERSGLDPLETGYVEAHGTGTAVGDPIETAAIASVFSPGRSPEDPLFLGSLKSQAGHLEGACGIASVIKAVLMLERGIIPPQGNFEKLNPKIPFTKWNFKVATNEQPWHSDKGSLRRASVNNFGFGGTNAHVILEEPPPKSNQLLTNRASHESETIAGSTASFVIPLTAKDEMSLRKQVDALESYLKRHSDVDQAELLQSLAYTMASRRSHYAWRLALPMKSTPDLTNLLSIKAVRAVRQPKLSFIFTGQGAQWAGMGQELMQAYPIFASNMRQADKYLRSIGASWSLLDEILTRPASSNLETASVSQPACTAIQISLFLLLESWGIRPEAVVGHSSGEIAAAFALGALGFEDCMKIAYQRGVASMLLKESHPKLHGAMLALGASEAEAEILLKEVKSKTAVIACINSPSSVTLSGDDTAITEAESIVTQRGLFNRRLRVDVAYHSHHMQLVASSYRSTIDNIVPSATQKAKMFSSLTGKQVDPLTLDASYWTGNLTSQVKFDQALQALHESLTGVESSERESIVLVEIGPHAALEGPAKQTLKFLGGKASSTEYFSALFRKQDSVTRTQQLASSLFMRGCDVNFDAINSVAGGYTRKTVLTDLPPYAWKHAEKYWYESRISKNHREKIYRRHDLLGSLTNNYNSLEPTWRNILDIEQVPWLRDHRVQANSVFPLAGYLVMAIEAAHQRAELRNFNFADSKNAQYVLREIVAPRALVIGESTEVEMMINLRPYNQSTREISDTWDEFSISSWTSETGWTEHCRGQVSVQKNESSNPFHSIDHSGASQGEVQTQMLELDTACKSEVDWENWLQTFSKGGIEYGPTFRGLTDVRVGGKHAVSLVQIPDTAATMPLGYESDYIIHPCTLDACCQASFPAFTSGQQLEQAYVPTFIKSLSVSHGFNSNPGDRLNNYFSVDPESKDEIRASGFVMNLSRNKASPILRIEGLTLSPLPCDDSDSSGTQKDDLCAQVTWEPSIDLLTTDQFTGLLGQDQIPEAEKLKFDVFEQAAYYLTERALKEVDPAEYDGFQEHHKKMYRWLQSEMNAASHGGLPMQTPDWMELDPKGRENFLQAVRNIGPDGELLCKIGEALPSIMRQEIDPLSIMFEDKLLDRWYQTNASLACGYARNARFVDMLGHQNPYLNILEIGGGTAGTTVPTLEALGGYGGKMARFVKYTFTDISAGFFEPAKQKLERWGGLVSYAKLDIEQDPIEQGFQAEAYDLVIAANVLHATSKMDRTLHHVRKLLKPGGKLALLEVTMTQLQHLIFATLPGWWLSEGPGYEKGPVMDEGRWDSLLKNAGFSGIDCSLQDFPREPEQNGSMMYSTAVSPGPEEVPEVVIVCENPPDGLPMKKLHEQVHALTGRTPTLASLGEEDVSGKICIFIQELNKPLLVDISPHSFEDIQKLFSVAHSVLWVVQDANIDCRNPDASMAIGLLRTIRSETGMRIVTLDLDKYQSPDGQSIVDTIARVFKWTLVSTKSSSLNTEMEYVERGGIVRIPRLVLASELNRGIDREMFEGSPELQQFPQKGRPLKMVAKQPGLLESLCFVEDEVPKTVLKDADVEISVKAVGLNFKDVLIAMGQVPDEPLGGELGGIINSVGSDVSTFTVGDRVCAAPSGSFAELVRCPSSMVAKIPDNVSFAEAASLPIAFITAYYSLIEVGRLNSGESVLIHAASGGVGQAAIQVAKMVGAHIYATVSTVEKRSHLIETYGIPENQIFYSRDTSFGEEIMRASQNRGVDVVLNSLSGEALHTSWECLAAYGRFVEIGKRDLQLNSRLGMQKFMRNSTFTAVDLGAIRADRPQLFMRVFRKVLELVAENALRAVTPLNAFSFSQMEQAFRLMQSGKHNGKIVLQVQKGDKVMALPRKVGTIGLRADASYLISGGTGGLGRSLSKWLVSQGARWIILASRSGPNNQKAAKLVHEIDKMGAKLVIRQCDVSVRKDVQELVTECAKTMPAIRGVIHGAMVLHDMLFEKSDYNQFTSITTPKVPGAWNLHHCTPKDMDFFIMLGSASGIIGNRGQGAYAATCAFLNAFAQYRASQGLPATCIDIGLVEDVGYAAEQWQLKAWLDTLYSEYVKEKELHAVIQAAINGQMENGISCVIGMRLRPNDPEFFWTPDPKFRHLRRGVYTPENTISTETSKISVGQALKQASSAGEAVQSVVDSLMVKMSSVLMVPMEDMSPRRSMTEYGLDSLVAVEIRNWISREMGAKVPLLTLLSSPSIERLADTIAKQSSLVDSKLFATAEEKE